MTDYEAAALIVIIASLLGRHESSTPAADNADVSADRSPANASDYALFRGIVSARSFSDCDSCATIRALYQALAEETKADELELQALAAEALAEAADVMESIDALKRSLSRRYQLVSEPFVVSDGRVTLSAELREALTSDAAAAALIRARRLESVRSLMLEPSSICNSIRYTAGGTPQSLFLGTFTPAVYIAYRPLQDQTKQQKKSSKAKLRSFTKLAHYSGQHVHTSGLGYAGIVVTVPQKVNHVRLWLSGALDLPTGPVSLGAVPLSVTGLPLTTVKKPHDGSCFAVSAYDQALGSLKEISSRVFTKKHVWRKATRNVDLLHVLPAITFARSDMIAIDCLLGLNTSKRSIGRDGAFAIAIATTVPILGFKVDVAAQSYSDFAGTLLCTPKLKQSFGEPTKYNLTIDTAKFDGPFFTTARYLFGTAYAFPEVRADRSAWIGDDDDTD